MSLAKRGAKTEPGGPEVPRDSPRETPRSTPGEILTDLAAGLLAVAPTAAATWWLCGGPTSQLAQSAALYLALSGLLLSRAPPDLVGPGLGPANRVTLFRASLAIPVAALALPPVTLEPMGLWWVIAVSSVVLGLDGLDGRIARSTGTSSSFGARFDMELDAALILALSVLVWNSGRAGAWVLLIGLMRYLFVVASWLWPRLRGELPESFRRKTVCVIQGVALLVALGPVIPEPFAIPGLALSLLTLLYSFALDIHFLVGGQGATHA